MSSTNKTTNYDLSQYIGSDKPTYLSDYNSDMYKIDAQMKVNADNIATAITGVQSATTTANTANATASQANTTANQANTTANSASTTAGNAQSTANSALSTATSAQTTASQANTKITNLETSLNISSFTNYNQTNDFTKNNVNLTSANITVACNSAGDIFKVYGEVVGTLPNPNTGGSVSIQTALRPENSITIMAAGICGFSNAGHNEFNAIRATYISITTNGLLTITVPAMNGTTTEIKRVILFPCLYFGKDFGDTPIQE